MSSQSGSYCIPTQDQFAPVRRHGWLAALVIAIGGQFVPLLGLAVPLVMVTLFTMSLMKGKYWCGNFCPHGSFFDVVVRAWSRNNRIPPVLRSPALVGAVLLFLMYNLVSRLTALWPSLGTGGFWEQLGLIFSSIYLMVLLAGGLLGLVISPRAWCQFCPMGTMQGFAYRLGRSLGLTRKYDEKVTLEDPSACLSCARCARACPMQLEPYRHFGQSNQFEDQRCIRCNDCSRTCPLGILTLATETEARQKGRKDAGETGDEAGTGQAWG